ncbi:MAG: hypothetical protein IT384_14470 [Deltaproteobacteria bacterium]|nr:hypothetical protein [Deltaproteobacteria bacterium]
MGPFPLLHPLLAALTTLTSTPAAGGLELSAGVFAARPSALEVGQLLGPAVAACWHLRPWSLGLSAQLGMDAQSDPSWLVRHTELRLSLHLALLAAVGRGAIGGAVRAGGIGLFESRTRHDAARLEEAGLLSGSGGFGLGLVLGVDATIRLAFYERTSVVLDAGPSLLWTSVAGQIRTRLGWQGTVSVAYALFGD